MTTSDSIAENHITIQFTGQFTISCKAVRELLGEHEQSFPSQPANQLVQGKLPEQGQVPRLAYSLGETAELLGVSPSTIRRLLLRGLLRSSNALRTKLIARKEIERFLVESR